MRKRDDLSLCVCVCVAKAIRKRLCVYVCPFTNGNQISHVLSQQKKSSRSIMSDWGQTHRPTFTETLQVISTKTFRFSQNSASSLISKCRCI